MKKVFTCDLYTFENWQESATEDCAARLRRENAAIAYAAVEAGIAPPKLLCPEPQGAVSCMFKEQESDMERDRR